MKRKTAASCSGLKFPKQGNDVISASEFKNMHQTEEALQSQCNEYLQFYPDLQRIRIPDLLWKVVYAIKNPLLQKLLGSCLGGQPDLILFKKDGKYNSCLAVELKVKNRPLRQNQKKWASVLNVYKVESFEDFERIFLEWYA